MKRFITIFPQGENVHLIKDVGMVPFFLQKGGYYQATLACYKKEEEMSHLRQELCGISYKRIFKFFKNENLNIFFFILWNIRKYDVIMFFHQSLFKTLIALFFKIITWNSLKFYFKLDANDSIQESKLATSRSFFTDFKVYLYNRIDLISVETRYLQQFLSKQLGMKVAYIPNGFDFGRSFAADGQINSLKKAPIITLVGRIGAPEKDNITMLKALTQVQLKGWTVEFLGPVDLNFQKEINSFYAFNNSVFKDKVFFRGAIDDREALMKSLENSSVFVQTSKFESFGIALLEAMSSGCYVVATDLTPSREIAGHLGQFFAVGDEVGLATILQSIIDEKIVLPSPSVLIQSANERYNWSTIVKEIYQQLENCNAYA